jgi:hypothetical protein
MACSLFPIQNPTILCLPSLSSILIATVTVNRFADIAVSCDVALAGHLNPEE